MPAWTVPGWVLFPNLLHGDLEQAIRASQQIAGGVSFGAAAAALLGTFDEIFTVRIDRRPDGQGFMVGNVGISGRDLGLIISSLPAWGDRPVVLLSQEPLREVPVDELADHLKRPVVAELKLRGGPRWQLRWPREPLQERTVVDLGGHDQALEAVTAAVGLVSGLVSTSRRPKRTGTFSFQVAREAAAAARLSRDWVQRQPEGAADAETSELVALRASLRQLLSPEVFAHGLLSAADAASVIQIAASMRLICERIVLALPAAPRDEAQVLLGMLKRQHDAGKQRDDGTADTAAWGDLSPLWPGWDPHGVRGLPAWVARWPLYGEPPRRAWLELDAPIQNSQLTAEILALGLHREYPSSTRDLSNTYVYPLLVPSGVALSLSTLDAEGLPVGEWRPGQNTLLPVSALWRVTIEDGGESWNLATVFGQPLPSSDVADGRAVALSAVPLSSVQTSGLRYVPFDPEWTGQPVAVPDTHASRAAVHP